MLKKIKFIALAFFMIAGFAVKAQDETTVKKQKQKEESNNKANAELILGLPKISDKTFFIISETTLKINGLVLVSFCEAHKLAMFKYNADVFEKPEDVIKAFEKENIFMPMLVKQGSFKDVEEMCSTK